MDVFVGVAGIFSSWLADIESLISDIKLIETEIFTFALGALFSYLVQLGRRTVKRLRLSMLNARLKRFNNKNLGITLLEFGPTIHVGIDSIRDITSKFVLPMPSEVADELEVASDFSGKLTRTGTYFGSSDCATLDRILKIDNVYDRLQPHILKVGNQFKERKFGISFNSVLYGVRRFRRTRYGPQEEPRLNIDCYETDYFTFKVIDSFHRELSQSHPQITLGSYGKDGDIEERLYPFLASIGLNFVIISADSKLILSRRSQNLDRFGYKGTPIYPSFNEALAVPDLPEVRGMVTPSIPNCFLRGLNEELGLTDREVEQPVYRLIGFGSVGIGFGVYGYARSRLTSAEITDRFAGQDRGLESKEFFAVPLKKSKLLKIVNDKNCSPQVVVLLNALMVDFEL